MVFIKHFVNKIIFDIDIIQLNMKLFGILYLHFHVKINTIFILSKKNISIIYVNFKDM